MGGLDHIWGHAAGMLIAQARGNAKVLLMGGLDHIWDRAAGMLIAQESNVLSHYRAGLPLDNTSDVRGAKTGGRRRGGASARALHIGAAAESIM